MIISVLAVHKILKPRLKKIARFTVKNTQNLWVFFSAIGPPVAHAYISRPNALNVFAKGVLKPAVLFFRFVCFTDPSIRTNPGVANASVQRLCFRL